MKISNEDKNPCRTHKGNKNHSTYRTMINYCILPIKNNASHRNLEDIFKVSKVNII